MRRRSAIFIGFAVVVLVLLVVFVINAGKFLLVDDSIRKSDAIIVLSGDRGERVEKAVDLYLKGYGKYFVISGGPVYNDVTAAELMKAHAIKLGVPEKAIIMEDLSDSTYENAHFTKQVIQPYNFSTAIVVSSNYHMKRVKMIFDREFKDTTIKLYYAGAKDRNFTPKRWWSNNKSIMLTITEYIKMIGYAVGKNY
ncbi:YdcF family protein [Neobacillus sp. Marseille-QA0830]